MKELHNSLANGRWKELPGSSEHFSTRNVRRVAQFQIGNRHVQPKNVPIRGRKHIEDYLCGQVVTTWVLIPRGKFFRVVVLLGASQLPLFAAKSIEASKK